ncbi:hypothetical protein [Paraclostridium dentum]|uniref:hypothetical protein n=1 Tax=Paraclostridium dentum TaxID=2662455 RepID=UPI003F3C8146
MTKKRRDKKNDSSSISKVAKAGGAALAIGVGAASFNKSALGKKVVSEILPAALNTSKKIGKDLREHKTSRGGSKRRIVATDIRDVYNKNKNTFNEQLSLFKKDNNKPIRINTYDKRRSLIASARDFQQNINNNLEFKLKESLKGELSNNLSNNLQDKYSKYNAKHIDELFMDAMQGITENRTINKNGVTEYSDFLDGKFKRAGFNSKDKKDFLDEVALGLDSINSMLSDSKYTANAREVLTDKMKQSFTKGARRENTLYGKASKAINKATGLDLDIEEMLTGSKTLTYKDYKDITAENPNAFENIKIDIKDRSANNKNKFKSIDLKEVIKSFETDGNDLDDLILDKSLKIYKDNAGKSQVYSTAAVDELLAKQYNKFSSSTLGRLFGQTDARLDYEAPTIAAWRAGSTGKEAA